MPALYTVEFAGFKGLQKPTWKATGQSGFLKPLVPAQGNGRHLASGIWARSKGLQGTDYAFWIQETHGVVDSGVLWGPRAEMEGLEHVAERGSYGPHTGLGIWSGV